MFSEEYDIREQLRNRVSDMYKNVEIVAISTTVLIQVCNLGRYFTEKEE